MRACLSSKNRRFNCFQYLLDQTVPDVLASSTLMSMEEVVCECASHICFNSWFYSLAVQLYWHYFQQQCQGFHSFEILKTCWYVLKWYPWWLVHFVLLESSLSESMTSWQNLLMGGTMNDVNLDCVVFLQGTCSSLWCRTWCGDRN